MPQPSVAYACGRIGVLRRSALGAAQIDRLMAAHTYADACRALADIGYAAAEGADYQTAADERIRRACKLLEAVTPDKELTDCFMLRYDIHNLKVLIKSRYLAKEPEYLSTCGVLKIDTLRHAVTERRYDALPAPIKQALDSLEKSLARAFDPMAIDSELDKAMYRLIFDKLAKAANKRAKCYFTAKVDMQNYIMLLRVKAMGKDAAFFSRLFLPCGSIPLTAYKKAFDEPDKLASLMKPYGQKVYRVSVEAALNEGKLPLMEKTADDCIYDIYTDTRYQTDNVDMLVSYLLSVQREATDVRLIMTGKLNGFSQEELAERVRELHG